MTATTNAEITSLPGLSSLLERAKTFFLEQNGLPLDVYQDGVPTLKQGGIHIQDKRPGAAPAAPVGKPLQVVRLETARVEPRKTRSQRKAKATTNGAGWFDMKRPEVTEEIKRDLQVIEYRAALDPTRFYKKDKQRNPVPEFFHMGTVVEAPHEYYSGRLTRKERRGRLADQLLNEEQTRAHLKRRAEKIRTDSREGSEAWYADQFKAIKQRKRARAGAKLDAEAKSAEDVDGRWEMSRRT
ncbi:rrna-processing protein fcf2 [Tieghemiomyces parasiticus]|uniref:Rrna-processing protein fcf2 n=1 Tax=Tieghemiomyces parasiticus TaxID=78921 RepID=A0A9W8E108_9FUNG|nr:rrna-processing protein fcf2 [Tieghemiomyces parasiticus]